MSFTPHIEIQTNAFHKNLAYVRYLAHGSKIMAVVKSDGYGHGLLQTAELLKEADGFAVARLDEGLALSASLKREKRNKPVLVLSGAHDWEAVCEAQRHYLHLVVQNHEQLRLLQSLPLLSYLKYWIKVDTGMNRLGFNRGSVSSVVEKMNEIGLLGGLQGIMTHFSNADDLAGTETRTQLRRFEQTMERLGAIPRSVANSAGIIGWPESRLEWVRPGIMLYGISPFGESLPELSPVMTFKARVIALKKVRKGARVGYGGTWKAPRNQMIGVIAAGYGDGYPREAPKGTPVLLRGKRVPIVGRVSMDSLTVDLAGHPDVRVGDEAILWGDGLPVEIIARAVGTIPYVLTCGVTGRVERKIIW